jgi:putative ABC transport system permease protein
MNFRQFAFNNVLRRKRTYAAHFMSSAFAVMIFFIYAVLLYHPSLQGQLASSSETASILGTMGLKISQYFIFIFSFLFLMYSAGAFLKARKREFGILMMLGMTDRQRNKLIFVENMIIGMISIALGIGAGILFTKLFLLVVERLLVLEQGLEFLVPIRAVWTTAAAFFLLFLVIALVISRVGRRQQLLDLIKSDEKPKEEPKASVWLSLLAVVLLLGGYGMVFYIVLEYAFFLPLLATAIGCVVLGTYFLFSQLSVYAIHALKRREKLLFRRINLLTLTDLAYRMRDNANMFFMVATVTAVAFCGIGVCLALADPNLSEKDNPYAFTYNSYPGNQQAEAHTALIDSKLNAGNHSYTKTAIMIKHTETGYSLVKLSEYNALAASLGYELGSLNSEQEALLIAGPLSMYSRSDEKLAEVDLNDSEGDAGGNKLAVKQELIRNMFGAYNQALIVQDEVYDQYEETGDDQEGAYVNYYYVVEQWEKTLGISREINEAFKLEQEQQGTSNYYFVALAVDWYNQKQMNGILFIMSVLVGVVFFTFAASFIYFRLYADLERDEKQYRMISKIGLSGAELKRLVTRQLVLMFFLPFAMAVIHSAVAFVNIQLLVEFPMYGNALSIYLCFFLMQLLYFFIIRWRYLRNLQQKLT